MSGNTTPGLTRIPDLQKVTEVGNTTDQSIVANGGVVLAQNKEITASASTYGSFVGRSTFQTIDAPFLTTGTVANHLIFCENADWTFDFEHAQTTDPTLFIHSANQATDEWISFAHDQTDGVLTTGTGNLKLAPAGDVYVGTKDIITDEVTGTKIGTATAQLLGFWNATPVNQPDAYTQTYAVANKTHAARTAATLTDNSGGAGADGTIDAIDTVITDPADTPADADYLRDDLVANTIPDIEASLQNCADAIAELADQVNKLIADQVDTAQAVNALIDDLQEVGIVG